MRSGIDAQVRGIADWRKRLAAVVLWCVSAVAAAVDGRIASADSGTYTGAAVVSPENDAAVRSNAGNLTVRVRIVPELREGHRLRLLLDGVPQGAARRAPVFELTNIDRGTHNLVLHIVDEADAVVFSGAPSTFHLLRHSRLHP